MRLKARDYQKKALEAAWDALQSGKSTIVVLPTGAGKSLVFARLARAFVEFGGGRVLIVAPRRDLVDIAEKTVLQESGYLCGVETGARKVGSSVARFSNGEMIVVASAQAMARRLHNFKRNYFGLLIFDEADLACAPSFLRIKRHFEGAKVCGFTATPDRHDRKPISAVFESRAHTETLREMIERGFLCPIFRRGIKIERSELDKDRFQAGDFDPRWLDEIFIREKHIHEVVKPMLELAEKRPTIVFGTSIRHGELLAEVFNRYRPGCARSVSGVSKDRPETMAAFRRGEFQFLCNCALLGRGVDIPPVACIGMARPTLSRTLYIQMIGRGTRTAPGKADLLVVDFTFNSDVHPLTPAAMLTDNPDVAALAEEFESEKEEGCESLDAVRRAEEVLRHDPETRKRILAKVRFQQRIIEGIDWTLVPDLGQVGDRVIADRLGVATITVGAARRRLGIGPPERHHTAAKIMLDPRLGTMSDVALAKLIGTTVKLVGDARKMAGVSAFKSATSTALEKVRNSGLLGKIKDQELAERYGVRRDAVCQLRHAAGAVAKWIKPRKKIDWATEMRLGKMIDRELAVLLGVSENSVYMHRRALGIAPFRIDRQRLRKSP